MMTTKEYEAHRAFIDQRDAIIRAAKDKPATHQTTQPVWHGCSYPAGQDLIASDELQALFATKHPDETGEWRWFIVANCGENICQLRTDEYTAK